MGSVSPWKPLRQVVWLGLALLMIAVGASTNRQQPVQAADDTARTIVIHKYTGTPGMATPDTKPALTDVPTGSYPLSDIKFQVTKIQNVSGKKLDATDPTTYTRDGDVIDTATTDLAGAASLVVGKGAAADGKYLVEETNGAGIPFVVSFPFQLGTDPNTIEVYPKNTAANDPNQISIEKYVRGSADGQNSDVAAYPTPDASGNMYAYWTLQLTRPLSLHGAQVITAGQVEEQPIGNGVVKHDTTVYAQYGHITLLDPYDATLGDPALTSVKLVVKDTDGNDQTITVPNSQVNMTIDRSTNVVSFDLSGAIIKTFASYAADSTRLQITYKNQYLNKAEQNKNTFSYEYYLSDGTTDQVTTSAPTSNSVTAYFPQLTINKVDDTGAKLANATFQIYGSEADAKADHEPIEIGGQTKFVTDSAGQIVLNGLDLGNDAAKTFYVVETDAPAGFDVDGEIHAITLDSDHLQRAVTVSDHDNLLPNFPMTGADFRLLVYGLAAVLLAAGSTVAYRLMRRRRLNR